jgi:hypothetical protein
MTLTTRPWDKWEDYAAGMYQHRLRFSLGPVMASVKLLATPDEFAETAREMIRAWPYAAAHNLNLPSGRRAWIGQASCCYHHDATAEETRSAWGRLPNETQRRANEVASAVIDEYLSGGQYGAETLFAS